MGRHKKEIIDRMKESAQEGLYLSDTHTVMCKYCNIRLEGQKRDALTKHMTSASHLKKKNLVYLIIIGSKNSNLYFFFCEYFNFDILLLRNFHFNAKITYPYV
jgi:hypothetical protein